MSKIKLPEIRGLHQPDSLIFETPEACLKAFNPAIIAAKEDEAGLSIYGEIGFDPLTRTDNGERRISAALRSIGDRDVTVNLNSPGGDFFSGLAIYNLLRLHKGRVRVHIIGEACSAASLIAMAGDEIRMGTGSQIMVHCASALTFGNRFEVREVIDLLTRIDSAMTEIYAARAGVDEKVAAGWLENHSGAGSWFDRRQAMETGLASGALDEEAITLDTNAAKPLPQERVIEKSLSMAGMSSKEAKAHISRFKTATRDACRTVTRDADETLAALKRLQSTIRSNER